MIQFGLVQFSTVPDASVNKELEYVRFTTLDNTYINFNCFELTSPFADKSRNPSAKKIQSKVSNDTSVPFSLFYTLSFTGCSSVLDYICCFY